MSNAINKLNLPWDQARVLRQVRDCGCIRARLDQEDILRPAAAMRGREWIALSVSPSFLYCDILITEAGRAIAG